MTNDPVPDHGMSRSRLLTNRGEFTTIIPSLLCNDVKSGHLDVAYAWYSLYYKRLYRVNWMLFSKQAIK